MRKLLLILLAVLSACSSDPPSKQWTYKLYFIGGGIDTISYYGPYGGFLAGSAFVIGNSTEDAKASANNVLMVKEIPSEVPRGGVK